METGGRNQTPSAGKEIVMARPIWTGTLSFGLLNVPIKLMPGERKVDLHFRMLDARDKTPIRYERVNAETGEEVPWKEIVKAYEFSKGSYVVLDEKDIAEAAAENRETVEIEAFVDAADVSPAYFEKPYVLEPGKKAEKGYVLLREVLRRTGKVGIGRVVIRTREYLAMVMPQDDALLLVLLRFPQELVDVSDYKLPGGSTAKWRISDKEMAMARQLIESMSGTWKPGEYRDEFRNRLRKVIEKRMKSKGAVSHAEEGEPEIAENAATNVVDFMSLLKKSLETNKRTPPKKTTAKKSAASKSSAKTPAKRPVAKKASRPVAAKRQTRRSA
jgi:DNA end-binding protein Ku